MTPEFIVIHNTANKAPAKNEIDYMLSNSDYTSFHFAVDDIEAVQGIPLDRNTWHASDGVSGRGNRKGISIEICYSYCVDEATWEREYKSKFEKAQENAAELTAYLLNKYGWGMDPSRIKKHEDFTNKHCPHRTLDDYGWEYFIGLVKNEYDSMFNSNNNTPPIYNTVEICPDYAQPSINKLISKGYLKGDEKGNLSLSKDMLRILVILDRAGVFGE
jgi:N-acetylmuramoyl-L-alanine amidase CwlA